MGAQERQTRELAHEILKPLGVDLKHLKDDSRRNFEAEMRSIVRRGQDNELYNRQKGWQKGDR